MFIPYLTIYCCYVLFYNFYLIIFILAYFSGLSIAFTILFAFSSGIFFISYKFLLIVVAFSFLLRKPLITSFRGG